MKDYSIKSTCLGAERLYEKVRHSNDRDKLNSLMLSLRKKHPHISFYIVANTFLGNKK